MTFALVAALVLLLGLALGFWMGSRTSRAEAALHQSEKAFQEQRMAEAAQRAREAAEGLAATQAQLARVQQESAQRAGFESLAVERQAAMVRLAQERTAEREAAHRDREGLVRDLDLARQSASETARAHAARIAELEAQLANEQQKTAEKIALLDEARKALADQFQALANDILDQKSKKFSEGSQTEIGNLLNPLKTQIEDFRKKVEEAQSDSKTGVAELRGLIGNLGSLNQTLAEEARNLTTALRGSAKTQGDWGEFILRDLLDKAGLREGEQYTFQQSFTGVEGENGDRPRTVRTDVILRLPGGRSLVIDSKVSLTAYADCVSAIDEDTRRAALRQHLVSVRGHIAGLARAGYHRLPGIEAPDFIVLFVPIEPALLLALQNDSELWSDAYKQGILLVGPTTLLYVIRIVHVLWQQELQSRSVQEVIERGTALYEKFVNFVADMKDIGESLRGADASYGKAMNKLVEGRGNLVRQVEMLKKLGIRTTKSLPKSILDSAAMEEESTLLSIAAGEQDATQNG